MNSPQFSRPPDAGQFGKCDERLDVPCALEFKSRAQRLATVKGYGSVSAWVRDVLEHELLRQEQEIDRIVAATGGDANWRKAG